jgi:predicted nucleic acid-binding protein
VLAVHAADERDFDQATRRDALLWATADRIGVKDLLTEDFRDGRTRGGMTFVDPFRGENERLLAKILPSP